MSYLVHVVYSILSLFPGLAARTHRPCGRMRTALRSGMAGAGFVFLASAALIARSAFHGFDEGRFGWFPATLLGALAAFLLTGGAGAMVHALRNPPPTPLPDNVIPFHRPVAQAQRDPHRYIRPRETGGRD